MTLNVRNNEVLALVGDGAGKSTLIKCLAGVISPTDGEMDVRRGGKLTEHVFDDSTTHRRRGSRRCIRS